MKKTLTVDGKRRLCNTATADVLDHETFGHYGDPAGYEVITYKTLTGVVFKFAQGGQDSPYPSPTLFV